MDSPFLLIRSTISGSFILSVFYNNNEAVFPIEIGINSIIPVVAETQKTLKIPDEHVFFNLNALALMGMQKESEDLCQTIESASPLM